MKKKHGLSVKALRRLLVITSFLMAVVIGVTAGATAYRSLVSSTIGGEMYRLEDTAGAQTLNPYTTNGLSLADWKTEADKLVQEVVNEGIVLLKNEQAALPLASGARVSLFSRSSVDLVLGGTGGGGIDASVAIDLRTALEEDGGYTVNPVLWDFYKTYDGKEGYKRSNGGWMGATPEQVFVAEAPLADYTDEVRASYSEYADAAIVVIARVGGEGSDMPSGKFGDGEKYLALQEQEKDLLREIHDSGAFSKIIALINTSNAMELSWVDQEEYGVQACLWVGGVGQSGARSIAHVLTGQVNPSGRLVDTYAADSISAPAMQNFGSFQYTNADDARAVITGNFGPNYVVYQEGIYVGYRYYETRYADSVLDPKNTNASSSAGAFVGDTWSYESEVVYPFGYGLSYGADNGLPFTQKIVSGTMTDNGVDIEVSVTNEGTTAGKSVIQLYAQQPYVRGGIEKSAIQLIGFDKTSLLQPGESTTVTIHADRQDFASYDYQGEKTYVLDKGEYFFAIGDSAHSALNNVLAYRGKTVADGMDAEGNLDCVYAWTNPEKALLNTAYSGGEITNRFDDADLGYYGYDVPYLTRSDWNTFPTPYTALTANAQMLEMLDPFYTYNTLASSAPTHQYGVDSQMTLAKMYGLSFDDPAWEKLLDQMTIDDMVTMVSGSALKPISNIAYPAMFMKDGPQGNTGRKYVEDNSSATGFCGEVVRASTFNRDLLRRVGIAMGEDWLRTDTEGAYTPASNTHRTPYAGRNFEYFSEDGFLSGEMGYEEVVGMQSKGTIAYIKHFVLNDQETNRQGVATFSNEQAIREVYLKAFEKPLTEGQAKGAMCAFNRIGMTWAQAHPGLMTGIVRTEWGSTAIMDTDMAMNVTYQNMESGLAAGNTMWATSGTSFYDYLMDHVEKDPVTLNNLRNAVHSILYNIADSTGINGLSPTAHVVHVLPYWETAAYVVLGVLGALTLLLAAALIVKSTRKKLEV
ncbi:MAG: glycoside hydrolase family 3 protein [Clostridia bacterium]|nr:glycoside hydrolase family 3 protein [Clostridia bacterium]